MAVIAQFIRGSDNEIKMTLTEDGLPVSGAWSALDISFGGVTLHRTADGNGITLNTSTGLLTISPGDLTTQEQSDIAALRAVDRHRVEIVVTSVLNDDGVVFGGQGSTPIYFQLSDKP